MRYRRTYLLCAALVLAAPVLARAQSAPPSLQDQAKAKFTDAKTALEQGDTKRALVLFQESLALQRRPSSLLNIAQCEELLGLWGSASRHYKEGMALLPSDDPRVTEASNRLASIAPRVPTIRVRLGEKAPERTTVLLDGEPIVASILHTDVLVDPGSHTVTSSAAGYVTKTQTLTVKEGTQTTLVVTLDPLPPAPPVARIAPPASTARPALPSSTPSARLRTGAFVTLGVAGASALVGVITGSLAYVGAEKLKQACPDHAQCDRVYQPLQVETNAFADASTGTFIVAGAALAGGMTMLFLSARKSKSAPTLGVGIGPGTLSVQGQF